MLYILQAWYKYYSCMDKRPRTKRSIVVCCLCDPLPIRKFYANMRRYFLCCHITVDIDVCHHSTHFRHSNFYLFGPPQNCYLHCVLVI